MKRYRQPFTHFILFYAGVFSAASLVGLVQEMVGAGHNLILLVFCLPAALYMGVIGAYAWLHWVEVSGTSIRIGSWRKVEEVSWDEIQTLTYSRTGLTLSAGAKTIQVSRWLRHYLELHEFILSHVPATASMNLPAAWQAELTGPLRFIAHLNFWILLGVPAMGIVLGLMTQGLRGLLLAGVSFVIAFAIARWVSFPVVGIRPSGSGLLVKRAVGSIQLDLAEIDSLTLFEANQSPWSLHNGFRMGYGSAELRARNRSIWIENPLCPEVLYHWLLGQGFALTPGQGCYRKLVRASVASQ